MSATGQKLARPVGPLTFRLPRSVAEWSPALRALVASRLVVVGAGTVGALAVPRFDGWSGYDPTGISAGLGAIGNVLAASAVRWDAIHYLTIAQHGYTTAASTVFFPLYPWLIHMLSYLTGSGVVAGMAISAGSFALALVMLHRLTELELGRRAADVTVMLLAFAPASFFFTAVYTESLFLALSIGAILAARRGRPALAAGLGALAAITRVTGVLLVIPLALIEYRRAGRLSLGIGWILAIPLALLSYLAATAARGFDLLAPIAEQTVAEHGHRMTGPVDTIAVAVKTAAHAAGLILSGSGSVFYPASLTLSDGAKSIVLLLVLLLSAFVLGASVRRLPLAYTAYGAAALLVSIWSPVAGQPLASLDRYTLTIFPLWMAAGLWVSERRLARPALMLSGVLLVLSTAQFGSWAFVS